jgi:hypothetical protein
VVAGVDVDGSKTLTFLGADRPVYPSLPAAAALGDARRILSDIGGRQPVDVAYHTSFAPEVTWGQQALAASLPGPGALLGAERQSIFEAHLACQRDGPPVDALLVTSWHVADPAKTTRLRYASGIELLMDHTAVAAYLLRDGRIEAAFGALLGE